MSTITRECQGHLLHEDASFPIEFTYDLLHPLALTMTFHTATGSVPWTVGRDLVASCLFDYEVHGDGDVTLTRIQRDPVELVIHLESPDGSALVVTTDTALRELIEASYALMPPGSEIDEVDVDEFLAECLGEAS